MKMIGFILMLLLCGFNTFAQVLNENATKYWFYRDRLKYFVYPGTEEGASVLMTSRNSNGSGGTELQYDGAEWGQTIKIRGYDIAGYGIQIIKRQWTK